MILNNFKKMINNWLGVQSTTFIGTDGNTVTALDKIGDAYPQFFKGMFGSIANINTLPVNYTCGYFGVVVGTGTTPVSSNDYALDSILTDGITSISTAKNLVNDTAVVTKTIMNNSSDTITINEVGVWTSRSINGNPGPDYGRALLIYREVLSTPMVLAPNNKRTLNITISVA